MIIIPYLVVLGAHSIEKQDILGIGFESFQLDVGAECFNAGDLNLLIAGIAPDGAGQSIGQLVLELIVWIAYGWSGPGKSKMVGTNLGDLNAMGS